MKRLLFINCAILITAIILASCQKETTPIASKPSRSQLPKASIQSYPLPDADLMFSPVTHYCYWPAWDCYQIPVIVIHGYADDLMQAELAGSLAVAKLFSSPKYVPICNEIGADKSAKLQSGNYVIQVTKNASDFVTFIAQKDSVSELNFDFAVQLED